MNRKELRAEHERLTAQIERVLEQLPPLEAHNPELRELVQGLQALTREYDQKLAEAEAQIAQLKRELFGPKADRLTREQQDQFEQLVVAHRLRPGRAEARAQPFAVAVIMRRALGQAGSVRVRVVLVGHASARNLRL